MLHRPFPLKPRFLGKLLLFALPFALMFTLLSGVLVYSGEAMPLRWVVAMQMGETPVLYRPQYGNRDVQFKALSVNTRRPKVVAVGSSRVLQMRAGLLTEQPTAFYNAGAPAWGLEQVWDFLNALEPNAIPEALIVGIDLPWFNPAYTGDPFPPPADDLAQIGAINRGVLQAVLDGRAFNLVQWLARRDPANESGIALGIKAIENGHGFRNDGSERYGDFLVAGYLYPPTERERHLEWMRAGEQMYVYGDGGAVAPDAMQQMSEIVAWSEAHAILLIGFFPPYTPELYSRMVQRGNHTYMDAARQHLEALFRANGFPLFDFSDGAGLAEDVDFFDGWHGSERVYLRLFTHIVEALPETLAAYADADALRALDAGVTDTFRVFPF
jgi:hypothetical protein